MINGNVCCESWKRSLCVRLDKPNHEQFLAEAHVHPMDITGRIMNGRALVEPAGIQSAQT